MSRLQGVLIASVVVAAIISSAWVGSAQGVKAAARQQWEYKTVPFVTAVVANATPEEKKASKIDEFGKLGAEGWELVAVSTEHVAYFKRQK